MEKSRLYLFIFEFCIPVCRALAIALAVDQLASPVTGIYPRSENLIFYVTYVPCNLLAWSKLLAWKMG